MSRDMKVRLVLAVPSSGRFVPIEWSVALLSLQIPMNMGFAQLLSRNRNRGEGRNGLVEEARKMGAEYLFFLDDDTVIPPNTLLALIKELESDPDAMVCGGIYTSKTNPAQPLVFKEQDGGTHWRWRFGDVFPCWGLGTGCMMIRMSVFDQIEKPYFKDIVWDENQGVPEDPDMVPENVVAYTMTDDLYFCSKLAQKGLKVLAHGGILPVHFSQSRKPHVLENTAYPVKGIPPNQMWYFNLMQVYNWITPDAYPQGWLTLEEARELARLATGKSVLELGSYKGRSTVAMAQTAKQVVSVDWHKGDYAIGECDTLDEFLHNIKEYTNIIPIVAKTQDAKPLLSEYSFDVVFVDAAHDFASVQHDMCLAQSRHPQVIAVHDWGKFDVTAAITAMNIKPTRLVGSLAIFEYPDSQLASAMPDRRNEASPIGA